VRRLLFATSVVALLAASCLGHSSYTEKPPASTPTMGRIEEALGPSPSEGGLLLRFAVIGDWGEGTEAQARLAEVLCEARSLRPFDIVVTTGDNFYDPDGMATDANYYGPEHCVYSHVGNQWRAAWGNHDYGGDDTADVLGAPRLPRYYSWSVGDVAFFVYDGTKVTGEQRNWLRKQVCGSGAKVKIIYGHQPPYSVGPHGSSTLVQQMVAPVVADCGVQLVLSGHDHIYMRSKPMDGVTYVVSGAAGGVLYDCESHPPWVAICASKTHFLFVEVTTAAIEVRAIGLDGGVIDSFTLRLTQVGP
jgi:predicted phosphodiesterase